MRVANVLLFCAAAAVTWLCTFAVRDLARACNLVDRNDHGIVPRREIPRVGGIALAAVFLGFGALLLGVMPDPTPLRTPAIWIASMLVFAVGLCDDLRGMAAGLKLLFLLAAGLVVARAGVRIEHLPLLDRDLAPATSEVVTMLWFAAVGTAWNFVDGLDGLAASLCVLAALGISFVALPADTYFATTLAGVALGFLIHNRHPASIFMGDGGAFFLGFWLSVLGIRVSQAAHSNTHALAAVLALAWPLADLGWALGCRVRKRALFRASADHLHYLLHAQLGHRSAVTTAVAIGGFTVTAAVMPHVTFGGALLMAILCGTVVLVGARASIRTPAAVVAMYISLWSARTLTREEPNLRPPPIGDSAPPFGR